MRKGLVVLAGLGVLLAQACSPRIREGATIPGVAPQPGIVERLNLTPGSVEAFHAALLERFLTDLGREGLRPNLHRQPQRRYDVGVSRHEEGTIQAAQRAPAVSGIENIQKPGIFEVVLTPSILLMLDEEGNTIYRAAEAATRYANLQDGQIAWTAVTVARPYYRSEDGPMPDYVGVLRFDVQEDRWRAVGFASIDEVRAKGGDFQQWIRDVAREAGAQESKRLGTEREERVRTRGRCANDREGQGLAPRREPNPLSEVAAPGLMDARVKTSSELQLGCFST